MAIVRIIIWRLTVLIILPNSIIELSAILCLEATQPIHQITIVLEGRLIAPNRIIIMAYRGIVPSIVAANRHI
jgi:hypothetical protein